MPNYQSRRRKRGGGWSDAGMIIPGQLAHNAYSGEGTDCPGAVTRPGYLDMGLSRGGVPGLSGGKRRKSRSKSKSRRRNYKRSQKRHSGGRYGFSFADAAPLNNYNDVGMASGAFSKVPCEMSRSMAGGAYSPAPVSFSSGQSAPSTVGMGEAGAAMYNAPNAGYRNDFNVLSGSAGGMLIQAPYDAGSFNQACLKTSGGKRNKRTKRTKRAKGKRSKGGSYMELAPYAPLKMADITGRADFDGTMKMLPMKMGGGNRQRS
jgi:hypothetical protein